jgi:uncharacterized protein
MLKFKKALTHAYDRFIELKGAPREIALGFALGLFVGMSPFFGMHIAISLVFASLLGWNKFSAIIGINITNILTAPFVYAVTYRVGAKVAGFTRHVCWPASPNYAEFLHLLKASPLILLDLCVGGVLLGIPIAVAGYYAAFNAVTAYRRGARRAARKVKRPGTNSQTNERNEKSAAAPKPPYLLCPPGEPFLTPREGTFRSAPDRAAGITPTDRPRRTRQEHAAIHALRGTGSCPRQNARF